MRVEARAKVATWIQRHVRPITTIAIPPRDAAVVAPRDTAQARLPEEPTARQVGGQPVVATALVPGTDEPVAQTILPPAPEGVDAASLAVVGQAVTVAAARLDVLPAPLPLLDTRVGALET